MNLICGSEFVGSVKGSARSSPLSSFLGSGLGFPLGRGEWSRSRAGCVRARLWEVWVGRGRLWSWLVVVIASLLSIAV